MQVRRFFRAEQRPLAVFHDTLHEQVRHPVGRVHVVRAAAIVAGVLAQFEEFLDVAMPGFQVAADRTLALAALIDGDRLAVGVLHERDDAAAVSVSALVVAAHAWHQSPLFYYAAGQLWHNGVPLYPPS